MGNAAQQLAQLLPVRRRLLKHGDFSAGRVLLYRKDARIDLEYAGVGERSAVRRERDLVCIVIELRIQVDLGNACRKRERCACRDGIARSIRRRGPLRELLARDGEIGIGLHDIFERSRFGGAGGRIHGLDVAFALAVMVDDRLRVPFGIHLGIGGEGVVGIRILMFDARGVLVEPPEECGAVRVHGSAWVGGSRIALDVAELVSAHRRIRLLIDRTVCEFRIRVVQHERHLGGRGPDMLLAVGGRMRDRVIICIAVLVDGMERAYGRVGQREEGKPLIAVRRAVGRRGHVMVVPRVIGDQIRAAGHNVGAPVVAVRAAVIGRLVLRVGVHHAIALEGDGAGAAGVARAIGGSPAHVGGFER